MTNQHPVIIWWELIKATPEYLEYFEVYKDGGKGITRYPIVDGVILVP
jgi:hypothetical protein